MFTETEHMSSENRSERIVEHQQVDEVLRRERSEREIVLIPKLISKQFKGDARLEKCLTDDSGRINQKLNNRGPHIEKIQGALETLDVADLKSEKGFFGPKTSIAVKNYKNDRKLLKKSQRPGQADDTIGKGTIGKLDTEMDEFERSGKRGGLVVPSLIVQRRGAALARRDAVLAMSKVDIAIQKLNVFATTLNARRVTESDLPAFDPVTVAALSTHFRLGPFDAASIAPIRPVTPADIAHILLQYGKMRNVFILNATSFTDGNPLQKDGKPAAAAANLNSGIVIFGRPFKNFTDTEGTLIGPNSRAAILIHEGFHAVDAAQKSGDDDNVHISEFSPKYAQQSADNSLFNPSSYASFAAHVFPPGKDPDPRFGLDPKGRLL